MNEPNRAATARLEPNRARDRAATAVETLSPRSAAPFRLPSLPYGYADLEPVIDAETMELHYGKHHQAYVDGLNASITPPPRWHEATVTELLTRLKELPADARTAVHDMGGGHANHSFFWNVLTPRGSERIDATLQHAINRDFGSFDQFRARFEAAGMKQFGSGWVLLVGDPKKRFTLDIMTVPNQNTEIDIGMPALLICDLWEHAYYLRYRNRRADWLRAWWQVVNWDYVAARFTRLQETGASGARVETAGRA